MCVVLCMYFRGLKLVSNERYETDHKDLMAKLTISPPLTSRTITQKLTSNMNVLKPQKQKGNLSELPNTFIPLPL